MIPLSRPDITEKEIRRVNAVLRSPYLSGGTALKEFEAKAARVAGTKYAVGVSSGTAALHLILLALGIGAGDEVITTPFSFVASANCILYAGAKPVFADIDPETLNLDPKEAEARITPRTKAILVVHVFGFPAAMDEFRRIAAENGVFLIEDACEAIGARWRGEPAGGLGTMGAFAFYPNKQVTTGEGGMVVTNEEGYAELVRSLSNQGRRPNDSWLTHERLGYNYRLDELSAALGCAQLDRLPEILAARERVAAWYQEELREIPELNLPQDRLVPGVKPSWFLYVVRFSSPELRERVAAALAEEGIENKPYFPAIHLQPFYRRTFGYQGGEFPEAERAAATCLALPFYNKLRREQIAAVGNIIKKAVG
ncbi:MAG: DegT/DnrJ/EryC1/StrS family aminotransferase [Clostridia bacterium]|jgi:perosamine synthetase|nr:DegT/DnrJ/EryC1/StrS family aminotransferase [Clostridia bacterium]